MELIKFTVFRDMTPCRLLAGCVIDVAEQYTGLYSVTFQRSIMLMFTAVGTFNMKCISVSFTNISIPSTLPSNPYPKKKFLESNIEISNDREVNFRVTESTKLCICAGDRCVKIVTQ